MLADVVCPTGATPTVLQDSSTTCICPPGYSYDGTACNDIDECATNAAGCSADATCTNLPGAFNCTCKPGFSGNWTACESDAPVAVGGRSRTFNLYKNTVYRLGSPGLLATDNSALGAAWFVLSRNRQVMIDAVANNATDRGGSYTTGPNGTLIVTPKRGYYGLDTFSIRATDGTFRSSPVIITLKHPE